MLRGKRALGYTSRRALGVLWLQATMVLAIFRRKWSAATPWHVRGVCCRRMHRKFSAPCHVTLAACAFVGWLSTARADATSGVATAGTGRGGALAVGFDQSVSLGNPAALARRSGARLWSDVALSQVRVAWRSTAAEEDGGQAVQMPAPLRLPASVGGAYVFERWVVGGELRWQPSAVHYATPRAAVPLMQYPWRTAGLVGQWQSTDAALAVVRRIGDSGAVALAVRAGEVAVADVRQIPIDGVSQELALAFTARQRGLRDIRLGGWWAAPSGRWEVGGWASVAPVRSLAGELAVANGDSSLTTVAAQWSQALGVAGAVGWRYLWSRWTLEANIETTWATARQASWQTPSLRVLLEGRQVEVPAQAAMLPATLGSGGRVAADYALIPGSVWLHVGVVAPQLLRAKPDHADLVGAPLASIPRATSWHGGVTWVGNGITSTAGVALSWQSKDVAPESSAGPSHLSSVGVLLGLSVEYEFDSL